MIEKEFAEEVARSRDDRTILFRVSDVVAEEVVDWSPRAVRFRFELREDGTYEMLMRTDG